jgi:hypothetical protein
MNPKPEPNLNFKLKCDTGQDAILGWRAGRTIIKGGRSKPTCRTWNHPYMLWINKEKHGKNGCSEPAQLENTIGKNGGGCCVQE